MLTGATVLQPPADVITTNLLDGEMVLLHLQTQRYYTLNTTGTQIWRGIEQGLPIAEVSRSLTTTYDVTTQEAEQVTFSLIQELVGEALVRPVEQ